MSDDNIWPTVGQKEDEKCQRNNILYIINLLSERMMFFSKSDVGPDGIETASGLDDQPTIVVGLEIGWRRASRLADDIIRNRIDPFD